MSREPRSGRSATPEELRAQVENTRERLGETVEELAAKADVKARAQEKAARVKARMRGGARHARKQTEKPGARALHLVKDKTPEPVRDRAVQAREHPAMPLMALCAFGAAALLVVVMSRRHDMARRQDPARQQDTARRPGLARRKTRGRRQATMRRQAMLRRQAMMMRRQARGRRGRSWR